MAATTLKMESISANPEDAFRARYYTYRHAKAAWDLALYAPEMLGDDVPDEINDPLSDAHTDALNQFLLTPAHSIVALARKLSVFREEGIHQGWFMSGEIVAGLEEDARRLAHGA